MAGRAKRLRRVAGGTAVQGRAHARSTRAADGSVTVNMPSQFTSVWDALENTPQEAASMKARAALMMAPMVTVSKPKAITMPAARRKRRAV